jgi:hypothetical protein
LTPEEAAILRDALARLRVAEQELERLRIENEDLRRRRSPEARLLRAQREIANLERTNARLARQLVEVTDAGRYWHGRYLALTGYRE